MFAKDKKAAPLMLLGLVGCGILLPLGIMSWYMLSSSKFTGPNQIMNDTYTMFMYSKYAIKESQVSWMTGGSSSWQYTRDHRACRWTVCLHAVGRLVLLFCMIPSFL